MSTPAKHSADAGVASTSWLDVCRVVAMLLVVLDHVTLPLADLADRADATASWWLGETLFAVSRLAVPLFIMVSGVLLLDPRRQESLGQFYRRRWRRIGVPLVFWALAYLAFRTWYLHEDLGPRDWIRLLAAGEPYYHLYYLYIAAGLYLLAPFLRRLVAALPARRVWALCAVLCALGVVDRFCVRVLGVGSPDAATMFVPYLGYFLLGPLLVGLQLTGRVRRLAAAAVVAGTSGVVLGTWLLAVPGSFWAHSYFSDYLSPAVLAAAAGAFVLLRTLPASGPGERHWSAVAALALGTYLVHPLLLDLVRKDHAPPEGLVGVLWWVGWLTTAAVLASLAVTWLLQRIPVLRRLV